jgi:hypothetical protein
MTKDCIDDFIEKETAQAVEELTAAQKDAAGDATAAAITIARAFGADDGFTIPEKNEETKLLSSFEQNLTLLIQKTWVEKSDAELKDQVLYQLQQFCTDIKEKTWSECYPAFLEIIDGAVYLMFGAQTKNPDFLEYAFRIDPEFGIFWWYIQSLPRPAEWSEDRCRIVLLLGMYFLANY